ncbi:LAETG motif-containing sortase-dependent surface protein [Streptomyces sp. NPDC004726]
MTVARRPLLTAAAAGSLLCALWFVPSANATAERPEAERQGTAAVTASTGSGELRLADTGSVDTTPYLVGGTASLAVGAGFVAFAVRRRDSTPM